MYHIHRPQDSIYGKCISNSYEKETIYTIKFGQVQVHSTLLSPRVEGVLDPKMGT